MNTIRPFFNKLLTILFVLILTLFVPCDIFRNFGSLLMLEAAELPYTQWHLPEGATARFGKGRVNDITFSPNGTQFAVATTFGTWIYDAQTGKEDALLTGHEEEVKSAVFSPDGQTLISADSSGQSRRWDVKSGEHLSILTEGNDIVEKVALSADSTKLVTMSLDERFRVWDLNDLDTAPIVIDDTERRVNGIVISHDGEIIAVTKTPFHSSSDRFVENYRLQVWNSTTKDLLINLHGEEPRFTSFKFSADGKTLITSDSNGEIQLWNVENGSIRLTIKGNEKGTRTLAFAPHSKLLASGDRDYKIRLWDISADGEQSAPRKILEGHKFGPSASAFSPDEKTLLTASQDGTILAWDVETGNQVYKITGHVGRILQLAFSNTGKTLISANSLYSTSVGRDTHLHHLEVSTGNLLSFDFLDLKGAEAVSPDFRTVALQDKEGKIQLWDINTKSPEFTLSGHPKKDLNARFVFSFDGKTVANGGEDGAIRLWKISNPPNTNLPWKILEGHTNWIWVLAISPNGKMLASGGSDKTVHLWNLDTGKTLFTFKEHLNTIKALAFSADGKILASGSEEGIYLWDTAAGAQLNLCIPERLATSMKLLFSPDSKTLVSACGGTVQKFTDVRGIAGFSTLEGGGTFQLWDAKTGELLSTHTGHTNYVKALAFSENSKTLATGSWDGTILLWDWEKIVPDR